VNLTAALPNQRRTHVEGRLRGNLMAWLTTVRPDGRPDTVPVWFLLREDETVLVYSRPSKTKLANIAHNPHVALCLDVTDVGRDVIRLVGVAEHAPGVPPADHVPQYVIKYAERIGALFGSPAQFAADYSQPLVITPERLYA
jgi:PPOX class probable F420-dependent enzyme